MRIEIVCIVFIFCALCLANLPFINQRILAIIPVRFDKKPLWIRLIEIIALYLVLGLLASSIQTYFGYLTQIRWEHYVITWCLFLIFAFPGFVYQYLLKKTIA